MDKLARRFKKVYLVGGNHDIYYKNTNSVNSVNFLQRVSGAGNVFVIDEKPLFIEDNLIGIYPWGFTPDNMGEHPIPKYGFGHFEPNGVELMGGMSKGCSYGVNQLFALGDEIFSGHYHLRNDYYDLKTGKVLHMVGSPLQLNWGDSGRQNGIDILDTDTGKTEFVENTVCAKFEKVYYSQLEEGMSDGDLREKVRGNFVKLIVDASYTSEKVMEFITRIRKFDPISFEPEYVVSIASSLGISDSINDKKGFSGRSNIEYLSDYLEKLYKENEGMEKEVPLQKLKEVATEYYRKALLPKDEREEKYSDED